MEDEGIMKHGGLRFIMGPFLMVPFISRRIQVLLSSHGSFSFRTFRTCFWPALCCLQVPQAQYFLLAGSSCSGAMSQLSCLRGKALVLVCWVPLFIRTDLGARGQWLKPGTRRSEVARTPFALYTFLE